MAKTVYCRKCGQSKDTPARKCWNCQLVERALKQSLREAAEEMYEAAPMPSSREWNLVVRDIRGISNGTALMAIEADCTLWDDGPPPMVIFDGRTRMRCYLPTPQRTGLAGDKAIVTNMAAKVHRSIEQFCIQKARNNGIREPFLPATLPQDVILAIARFSANLCKDWYGIDIESKQKRDIAAEVFPARKDFTKQIVEVKELEAMPTRPTYLYLPIEIFTIDLIVQDGQFNGFVADVSVLKQPKLRLAFGRDDRADTPYDTRVTAPNMRDRIEKDLQEWYIRKYGIEGLGTARFSFTQTEYIKNAVWDFLDSYSPPKDTPSSGPEVREINGVTVTGYGLDNLQLVLSPTNQQFAVFLKNTNIPVKVLNAVKDGKMLSQITYGAMQTAFTPRKNAVLTNIGESNDTLYWLDKKTLGPYRAEDDPAKVRARYEATIAEAMRRDPKVAEAASLLSKSLASPSLAGFTDREIEYLNQIARASLVNQKPSFRFVDTGNAIQNSIGGAYSYNTDPSALANSKPLTVTISNPAFLDSDEINQMVMERIGTAFQAKSKPAAKQALPAVQPTEFTRAIDLSDD